ncbi:hypothetical protein NE237_006838 [Protea cynaroides]|uniref:Glutaredoxin domain-containing protein n=1 Tax=Protea cynaroides TaxID=273540 RepID=A0A9Q0QVW8_9MAGN|nr:hypothetical protein NE237_006838 [Protea cynaroides]
MGCASSKEKKCRHCGRDSSPLSRTYSDPLKLPLPVDQRPRRNGESHLSVSLISSTLGILKLDSPLQNHQNHHNFITTNGTALQNDEKEEDSKDVGNYNTEKKQSNCEDESQSKEVFSRELLLAKTWSDMINHKIPKIVPKTPITTPPGEPETINTWELMEGLEDTGPLRLPTLTDPERCFSFNIGRNSSPFDPYTPRLERDDETPIPPWLQTSNRESESDPNPKAIVSNFDPEIISTFRKALEEISPTNTSLLRSPEPEMIASPVNNRWLSILSPKTEAVDANKGSNGCQCPPGGEDKVVIYFTSLRGVRKTYEDCCQVRVIMKGLGVRVDERDVSMHYGFKEELMELLGNEFRSGYPRVFVKGSYIGGVDEIRQLHEDGGLEKLVHGCEKVDDDDGGLCTACGDIRFVPCERCSGSCKIYYEGGDEVEEEEGEGEGEEEEEEEAIESGFIRCPECNENGLVRCPVCCC